MKSNLSKYLLAANLLLILVVIGLLIWPGGSPNSPSSTSPSSSSGAGNVKSSSSGSGVSTAGGPSLSHPGQDGKSGVASVPHPFTRDLPRDATVNIESGVASSFKSSDYTPVTYPDGTPRYDGETVLAYIKVPSGNTAGEYRVNQAGEYPRVYTQPKERAEVHLQFSGSAPGTAVAVVAQDGGKLANGKISELVRLDEHRRVGFEFQVSGNPGIHRVTVTTSAGQSKVLNFWAGAPHVLRGEVAAGK